MNRKMKHIRLLCCCVAIAAMLSACARSNNTPKDYSNTTLTGKVTAISGTMITLQLGELSEVAVGAMDFSGNRGDDNQRQPPSGGMPSGDATGEVPPQKPTDQAGGADGMEPPEGNGTMSPSDMVNGPMSTFTAGDTMATIDLTGASVTGNEDKSTLESIAVGDVLVIVVGEKNAISSVTVVTVFSSMGDGVPGGMGTPPNGAEGGFGGSGQITQGTSAYTLDTDGTYSNETYISSGDDENALRVDGASVALDGITVDKSAGASSNTEDGDFYGQNAALLATNGAQATIKNAAIVSSAQNGNGVFSFGTGTVVTISDSQITTTADNSGGIQTTGGGTTIASNLTVETSGNSSAAIRSDRGGGTVSVDGGTYISNGYNSPAVYSTAGISARNATLTANNSEALVIEGKNSIALENCTVSGSMSDTMGSSSDENVHCIMIYQSMSGDADVGTSAFSMTGGSLTSYSGDMFYVTNTHCVMTLSGVLLQNSTTDGCLLRVCGNSATRGWGSAGANGAQVELTADAQTLIGSILVDNISTLRMTLTGGSSYTGAINITQNEQNGATVENNVVVTIDTGCTWSLTSNCTLSSLTNNGTIAFNGYTITLADGTVLRES